MSWTREMGQAYSDGVLAGKKDFTVGVYSTEKAENYSFKACYIQGYEHGWKGMRKDWLHSSDHDKISMARKRTALIPA